MRSRTVSGDAMKMATLNKKDCFRCRSSWGCRCIHGPPCARTLGGSSVDSRTAEHTSEIPSASGKGVSRFRLAIGSMWVAFSGCQQLLGNSQIGLEEGPRLMKEGPESRRRGMVGI